MESTNMSFKPRTSSKLIAIALLTSLALSGCGIRGSLKTPPPIWGDGIPVPANQTTGQTNGQTTGQTTGQASPVDPSTPPTN